MKKSKTYTLGKRKEVGGKGLLRAKKPRYKYKNFNTYIYAVYNNNKA